MIADVLEAVSVATAILLVEDEPGTRRHLARKLEDSGFEICQAENATEALRSIHSLGATVVLMDIELSEDTDGIACAEMILRASPFSSIILVTAYAEDATHRERVRSSGLRVAGWIPKSTLPHLKELVGLIQKELKKVNLRQSFAESMAQGISPRDHLHSRLEAEPNLTPEIVEEVLEELSDSGRINLDTAIRCHYAAIRGFITRESGSNREVEVSGLLRHLRALQAREAEEAERRFLQSMRVRPGEGYRLVELADRLLEGES